MKIVAFPHSGGKPCGEMAVVDYEPAQVDRARTHELCLDMGIRMSAARGDGMISMHYDTWVAAKRETRVREDIGVKPADFLWLARNRPLPNVDTYRGGFVVLTDSRLPKDCMVFMGEKPTSVSQWNGWVRDANLYCQGWTPVDTTGNGASRWALLGI